MVTGNSIATATICQPGISPIPCSKKRAQTRFTTASTATFAGPYKTPNAIPPISRPRYGRTNDNSRR